MRGRVIKWDFLLRDSAIPHHQDAIPSAEGHGHKMHKEVNPTSLPPKESSQSLMKLI